MGKSQVFLDPNSVKVWLSLVIQSENQVRFLRQQVKLGSSATGNKVGQPSTDGNACEIGSARLKAQTLTVQAVPA